MKFTFGGGGAPRGRILRRVRQILTAERRVPQSPRHVHAFLVDLGNHWRLSDRYLRLEHIDPDQRGARIVIGSPVGLRRTARTTVTSRDDLRLAGSAAVGRRTTAHVHWTVEPHDGGARIRLGATVLRAGALDRALLALGGRWWLRRRFDRVLGLLAAALAQPQAQPPGPRTHDAALVAIS